MSAEEILYFAFGSNLLKERIQLDNDCQFHFKSIAKLNNYKLTFDKPDSVWRGGAADIVADDGAHVWGVVWATDARGIERLDFQEAVARGVYESLNVTVETPSSEKLHCRSYSLVHKSSTLLAPSRYYKDVIVRGALNHKLPEDYIDKLKGVPVNEFVGDVCPYVKLGLQLQ